MAAPNSRSGDIPRPGARGAAHIAAVEKRAYERGGLAFERRNEDWHESVHTSFVCREIDDEHVEVTTPCWSVRAGCTPRP